MTRIVLDSETLKKLHDLRERMEVCDERGKLLGIIIPATDSLLYRNVDVPIDEEELQRREQESDEYTTSQVLNHLKSLESA